MELDGYHCSNKPLCLLISEFSSIATKASANVVLTRDCGRRIVQHLANCSLVGLHYEMNDIIIAKLISYSPSTVLIKVNSLEPYFCSWAKTNKGSNLLVSILKDVQG